MALPYSVRSSTPASQPAQLSNDDVIAGLLSPYGRRNEGAGGVGKGAMKGASYGWQAGRFIPGVGMVTGPILGAVIGGIAGAFTKNAKTAMTDFSVNDAQSAVTNAYRQFLGRDPEAGAVQSQLAGQGLKAGHKWVGESGLTSVLNQIRNSAEAKQYASRGSQPTSGMTAPTSGNPLAQALASRQQGLQAGARQMTPQTVNRDALLALLRG
jgi:hypothetical protein